MKKGGRAKASVQKPTEGSKKAPMPKGGMVKFGFAAKARKGKKAQCYQRGQSVDEDKDYVPRSITLADFLVVLSGLFMNITRAINKRIKPEKQAMLWHILAKSLTNTEDVR